MPICENCVRMIILKIHIQPMMGGAHIKRSMLACHKLVMLVITFLTPDIDTIYKQAPCIMSWKKDFPIYYTWYFMTGKVRNLYISICTLQNSLAKHKFQSRNQILWLLFIYFFCNSAFKKIWGCLLLKIYNYIFLCLLGMILLYTKRA